MIQTLLEQIGSPSSPETDTNLETDTVRNAVYHYQLSPVSMPVIVMTFPSWSQNSCCSSVCHTLT